MSKIVHCVRVANILHQGGTFWEHNPSLGAWFPLWDRITEWSDDSHSAIHSTGLFFFREKPPELGADGRELQLKVPFVLPAIEHYEKPEPHVVLGSALVESVLQKQSLPVYRHGRGQSHDDRIRHLNDDGDLMGVNVPMRSVEDYEIYAHGLGPIEQKHRRWLATMTENGRVEPYRMSPVEARGAGGAWVTAASTKPIRCRPLLAQLKSEFLSPDPDDESQLLFNRDWFYIHAVLGLTDSEWYAWELLQQGLKETEVVRLGEAPTPAERYAFNKQAEHQAEVLGTEPVKLGRQTAITTVRKLREKLADARELFSGSPELRSMGTRYRCEFMLGLSAYRATSPARTAVFSDRGYTVRYSAARTEIPAASLIRPFPRHVEEGLHVSFGSSLARLTCQCIIDLDELFPPEDQHPGLLLRMLNEPDYVPSVLLKAA